MTAMELELDTREMQKFINQLALAGNREIRQELYQFLRSEAKKQQTCVKQTADRKVKSVTGNYKKGIKVGKRYYSRTYESYAARVYAGKPAYHAGLIEFGHQMSGWAARSGEKRRIEGRDIFADAHAEFQPIFEQDAEQWSATLLADKLD